MTIDVQERNSWVTFAYLTVGFAVVCKVSAADPTPRADKRALFLAILRQPQTHYCTAVVGLVSQAFPPTAPVCGVRRGCLLRQSSCN